MCVVLLAAVALTCAATISGAAAPALSAPHCAWRFGALHCGPTFYGSLFGQGSSEVNTFAARLTAHQRALTLHCSHDRRCGSELCMRPGAACLPRGSLMWLSWLCEGSMAYTQTFCASLNPISRRACEQHPGCTFVGGGHRSHGSPARKFMGLHNMTAGSVDALTDDGVDGSSGSSAHGISIAGQSHMDSTRSAASAPPAWHWQRLGPWHPNSTASASGELGCTSQAYAGWSHAQRQEYLHKYFQFDPTVWGCCLGTQLGQQLLHACDGCGKNNAVLSAYTVRPAAGVCSHQAGTCQLSERGEAQFRFFGTPVVDAAVHAADQCMRHQSQAACERGTGAAIDQHLVQHYLHTAPRNTQLPDQACARLPRQMHHL